MIKRKKVLKWINKQAELLPPEDYEAIANFHKPLKNPDGGGPIFGLIEKHPVNHARRLKEIYDRDGFKGVNYYFLARGFELKTQI